ncbi:thiopeptide-type bacteriocin biosynthesis protein [Tumebacillus sp. BK434]|uniref:thiopeptide-type bacteriocin biosynthesis protein n=1 Tax=Tumebacillus sp. BK434 TaxID=2512169 RepID=UPI0010E1C777|nr:thiopeptide-type bacteriocin biosynthesis protein [Tumebacillus sp. BK434]TCP59067.1 thiopeptide-type bacteriocin biosynthesis protein [Tumebacillus sp. BK434]
MTEQAERNWMALHLFYHHFEKQDDLLLDCLMPAVRKLQAEGHCKQWFFLRYWDGGPHIRIRFLEPADQVEPYIREQAEAYMRAHPPEQEMSREAYYAQHKFDGEEVDRGALPWYGNGSIVKLPYEPEVKRYGGAAALPVSEDLFTHSSDIVEQALCATRGEYQKRMSIAMDLMLLTALCLGVRLEDVGMFFWRYMYSWQTFVDQPDEQRAKIRATFERQRESLVPRFQTLAAFVDSEQEFLFYRQWVNHLKAAFARYEALACQGELACPYDDEPVDSERRRRYAIASIAVSQIHMTNNRLGVLMSYEHYLSCMLHLAASEAVLPGEEVR